MLSLIKYIGHHEKVIETRVEASPGGSDTVKEGKENGTYRRGNDFDWPRGRGQEDRETRAFEQARDTEKAPGPVTRRSCWGCGLTGSGPSGAGAGTTGQQSATGMPDTKTRDNRTAGMRGRRAVRGSERLRGVEDKKTLTSPSIITTKAVPEKEHRAGSSTPQAMRSKRESR